MIGAFFYPQIINKDLNRRLAKKKKKMMEIDKITIDSKSPWGGLIL